MKIGGDSPTANDGTREGNVWNTATAPSPSVQGAEHDECVADASSEERGGMVTGPSAVDCGDSSVERSGRVNMASVNLGAGAFAPPILGASG